MSPELFGLNKMASENKMAAPAVNRDSETAVLLEKIASLQEVIIFQNLLDICLFNIICQIFVMCCYGCCQCFFPGKVEIRRELEHAGAKWRSYGSRYCQVDA